MYNEHLLLFLKCIKERGLEEGERKEQERQHPLRAGLPSPILTSSLSCSFSSSSSLSCSCS